MSGFIEFNRAHRYSDRVLIDPEEVAAIERVHLYDPIDEYSKIIMRSGATVTVHGRPEKIYEQIKRASEKKESNADAHHSNQ